MNAANDLTQYYTIGKYINLKTKVSALLDRTCYISAWDFTAPSLKILQFNADFEFKQLHVLLNRVLSSNHARHGAVNHTICRILDLCIYDINCYQFVKITYSINKVNSLSN